ncbi:MAG: hypothetical protein AAGE93_13990, partial [Bacteroidota bacterium]
MYYLINTTVMRVFLFLCICSVSLAACQGEPEQSTDFSGRWYRSLDRQMYKQDTITRAEQFATGVKIYTVWEEAGLFRYVYRNDTLLTRTKQQLDVNYEFHFHTETEGELFIYNAKDTREIDENTKRLFHS